MLDLDKRTELCCPKCGKPLLVEFISETRARLLGCGRDCLDTYIVPPGSVVFGLLGGPQFLYGPIASA